MPTTEILLLNNAPKTLPPGSGSPGGEHARFTHPRTMKPYLLLAGLLPGVLVANAIRQTESPAGATPAPVVKAIKPAQERWKDLAKSDEASFRRHVIPLMSRSGCSGRECHGSFQGRGGFQLSLFGYDFDKDHEAITKGKGGADEVRVDLKEPMKSLVLAKPSLDGEEHKGKKRFDKGSWEYNLILRWIQNGAKSDVAETGDFAKLEVSPKELVFKKGGEAIQLKVVAHWKDGTVEDVTQLTRFRTNDESVALVNENGLVTSKTPGDTHIVAFYDNGVEPVPAVLPLSDRVGANFPKVNTRTKVDEHVIAKLRKTGILPSEICTDTEFLRRASLDVMGTLPTAREVEAFAKDTAPDKRAKKVDELLSRPAYAAWWTTKLCDFTGNNPKHIRTNNANGKNLNGVMSRQWYDWIYKRIAENTPYDQLAAGIVLATSRTSQQQTYGEFVHEMGSYFRTEKPADFAQRPNLPYYWMRQNVQKPEEKALSFAHTFLGVRIECAQCHKHPFDQWTKTDFEHFQAFFSGVAGGYNNGGGEKMSKEAAAAVAASGEMTPTSLRAEIKAVVDKAMEGKPVDPKKGNEKQKYEQTEMGRRLGAGEPIPWDELYVDIKRVGQPMKQDKKDFQNSSRVITPKILGGGNVAMEQYSDPRAPLMEWLRSKENPYFAKAFVNRVWASYFSRGIVEPADDLNLANAPSNAELFNYLANGFVSHNFDIKWLHREILNSDTYQRSWKTNATNKLDEKNFSHAVIRRLPAEVVFDAIAMATASTERAEKFATEVSERTIGPNTISGYGGKGGGDNYALTIFGKPAREVNCDCERTTDPTLLQTIYTRNDPGMLSKIEASNRSGWMDEVRGQFAPSQDRNPEAIRAKLAKINEKAAAMLKKPEKPAEADAEATERYAKQIRQYEERVAEVNVQRAALQKQLAEAEKPQRKLDLDSAISEVFLRTVSRPASADEIAQAKADIAAAKTPVEGIRDLLWAMLNTREFMVNH